MTFEQHARNWFSEHGEDGITMALCNRLQPNRFFIEIGSGAWIPGAIKNNTYALVQCGWNGMWLDAALKETLAPKELRDHVSIIAERVTVENAFSLLKINDGGAVGLLSIRHDAPALLHKLCDGFFPRIPQIVVAANVEPEKIESYGYACVARTGPSAFFVRSDLAAALS